MFKTIRNIGAVTMLTLASTLVSCEDYLEVVLEDQLTRDETFSKRASTEQFLANVYSYMPRELEYLDQGSEVPRSSEAMFSWYQWVYYLNYNNGNWGTSTTNFHMWDSDYICIKKASVFINHVDECTLIPAEERAQMKAEARFLRAYAYFRLFRVYGPVFLWGDKESDETIDSESIDRHTVDQNVDFMVEELDKAIADLPLEIEDMTLWAGRVTKGAAMALKSRLLLYAASPLFNGCDLYKGQMKNMWGDYLFPQTADPTKWEKAAQAAKDLIDLGIYELYQDTSDEEDPFQRAMNSYRGVYFEPWNKEIIMGSWARTAASSYGEVCSAYVYPRCQPNFLKYGYCGFCPSLKLVDTYPMAESGRYPVTGYNGFDPIVDEKSGYVHDGFTENYQQPGIDFAPAFKAHNSCVGRDARFYCSVMPNGFYWVNKYHGVDRCTFYTGGTSPYDESLDCVKVGYLWIRPVDPTVNTNTGWGWGNMFWPYFRLAEIYLNYAEACNEKPSRNESEALTYINLVRNRAGLNNIEEAYPEVIGNQELLRTLIQKERMVELSFECLRYYDTRRWMIAPEEFVGSEYTLNLLATTYEDSWVRTDKVWKGGSRVWEDKHYFFPMTMYLLAEMKNLTQNYGW